MLLIDSFTLMGRVWALLAAGLVLFGHSHAAEPGLESVHTAPDLAVFFDSESTRALLQGPLEKALRARSKGHPLPIVFFAPGFDAVTRIYADNGSVESWAKALVTEGRLDDLPTFGPQDDHDAVELDALLRRSLGAAEALVVRKKDGHAQLVRYAPEAGVFGATGIIGLAPDYSVSSRDVELALGQVLGNEPPQAMFHLTGTANYPQVPAARCEEVYRLEPAAIVADSEAVFDATTTRDEDSNTAALSYLWTVNDRPISRPPTPPWILTQEFPAGFASIKLVVSDGLTDSTVCLEVLASELPRLSFPNERTIRLPVGPERWRTMSLPPDNDYHAKRRVRREPSLARRKKLSFDPDGVADSYALIQWRAKVPRGVTCSNLVVVGADHLHGCRSYRTVDVLDRNVTIVEIETMGPVPIRIPRQGFYVLEAVPGRAGLTGQPERVYIDANRGLLAGRHVASLEYELGVGFRSAHALVGPRFLGEMFGFRGGLNHLPLQATYPHVLVDISFFRRARQTADREYAGLFRKRERGLELDLRGQFGLTSRYPELGIALHVQSPEMPELGGRIVMAHSIQYGLRLALAWGGTFGLHWLGQKGARSRAAPDGSTQFPE